MSNELTQAMKNELDAVYANYIGRISENSEIWGDGFVDFAVECLCYAVFARDTCPTVCEAFYQGDDTNPMTRESEAFHKQVSDYFYAKF